MQRERARKLVLELMAPFLGRPPDLVRGQDQCPRLGSILYVDEINVLAGTRIGNNITGKTIQELIDLVTKDGQDETLNRWLATWKRRIAALDQPASEA